MSEPTRKRTRSGGVVAADEALAVGSTLGRFVIVRHLGRGGMGAVYEAEDTLLERRVALKVVTALSADGRNRMLSEARALAKIKHANVVQLHDVGVENERVYLALELVRGKTLAKWLAENEHDWGDVVVHFSAAGRGLAEAHDAGLAHGDFKPSNVLVARDGRVLVSDFGLAQSMESETTSSGSSSSTQKRRRIVGTPAYIAPELYRGGMKCAATDQFAFCVALYEALFGVHPFGGGRWEEVAREISGGHLRVPQRSALVPRHVRRAVLRGLAHQPEQRWESMTALLDRLTGPPSRPIPRSAWAVGGVAVVGIAALTLVRDSDPCRGDPSILHGTWDDSVRARVATAFVGSGGRDAKDKWPHVEATIDEYTGEWLAAHQQICAASHDGDQSDADLDARMACLRRASQSLSKLTGDLTRSQPDNSLWAISAVAQLPPPSACAEPGRLPEAPSERGDALLDEIQRGHEQQRIGRLVDAQSTAEAALQEAEAQEHCEGTARAGMLLGGVMRERGKSKAAIQRLERAVEVATGCGRVDLAADASLAVADTIARRGVDGVAAKSWLSRARDAASAVPDDDTTARALFDARALLVDARVDKFTGDYEAADRHVASALPLVPDAAEAPRRQAVVRAMLLEIRGQTRILQGRSTEAEEAFRGALDILEDGLGPRTPRVAGSLVGLATVAMMNGDDAVAVEHLESALKVLDGGYGPAHPRSALVLNNLAAIEAQRGEYNTSRNYILRAIKTVTATGSQRPEDLITMRINAATLAGNSGDHASAALEAESALRAAEADVGRDSRVAALALRVLAASHNSQGEPQKAEAAARRAITILEKGGDTVVLHAMRALLAEVISGTSGNEVEVLALLKPVREACLAPGTAIPDRACARAAFFTATSLPPTAAAAERAALVEEARALLREDTRVEEYRPFHDRISAWTGA